MNESFHGIGLKICRGPLLPRTSLLKIFFFSNNHYTVSSIAPPN